MDFRLGRTVEKHTDKHGKNEFNGGDDRRACEVTGKYTLIRLVIRQKTSEIRFFLFLFHQRFPSFRMDFNSSINVFMSLNCLYTEAKRT